MQNTKIRIKVPGKLYENITEASTQEIEDAKTSLTRQEVDQLYRLIEKVMVNINNPETVRAFLNSAVDGLKGKLKQD